MGNTLELDLDETARCRLYADRLRGMRFDLSAWMYGADEADRLWEAIEAGATLLEAQAAGC